MPVLLHAFFLGIIILKHLRELLGSSASLRGQLMRGGAGTVATMVGGKLLLLAVSVVLARLLGASQYGSYAFAMAVVGLLAIPLQLGFPQLLIRRSAIFKHHAQLSALKGVLLSANRLILLLSIALGMIIAVAILVIPSTVLAASTESMLWALLLLPLLGLSGLRAATLRGLGRVVWSQLPESVLQPFILLALVGIAVLFVPEWPMTDTLAIQMHVTAQAAAFGAGVWFLYLALPAGMQATKPLYDTTRWLREALPYLLLAGAQIIIQHTDTLMLGVLKSSSAAGIYHVVAQIAMLVVFVLTAVNMVMAPHIARLHNVGDLKKLQQLISGGALIAMLGALPFVLIFLLFGREILVMVFGSEFISGYTPLWILCFGQLFNAAMGSVGLILNMTGHAWYSSAGVAIAALANVVANALLIPRFGMAGAAVATAVSLVIWNLLLCWWVYRQTGLISLALPRFR